MFGVGALGREDDSGARWEQPAHASRTSARLARERPADDEPAIAAWELDLAMGKQQEPATPQSLDDTQSRFERVFGGYLARGIHGFLSVLAVVIVAAAAIATYDTVTRDFPAFFQPRGDEYNVLQEIISTILLIAIAAELGLLLLFHRASAAMEVIILVIARKIVAPETTALELLLGVLALGGLVIIRYYFLPGRPK